MAYAALVLAALLAGAPQAPPAEWETVFEWTAPKARGTVGHKAIELAVMRRDIRMRHTSGVRRLMEVRR